jgi:hypothetical protein
VTRGGVAPTLLWLATACATETEILFGDPGEIVGADAAAVTSGGSCEPDLACEVSFRDDVFPVLANTARCGSEGCHATAIAQFEFPPEPGPAREALLAYVFQGSEGYVVPCEPTQSKLLCNLNLGEASDPTELCGSPMPKLIDDEVGDEPLDEAQRAAVFAWVDCGAPDN